MKNCHSGASNVHVHVEFVDLATLLCLRLCSFQQVGQDAGDDLRHGDLKEKLNSANAKSKRTRRQIRDSFAALQGKIARRARRPLSARRPLTSRARTRRRWKRSTNAHESSFVLSSPSRAVDQRPRGKVNRTCGAREDEGKMTRSSKQTFRSRSWCA